MKLICKLPLWFVMLLPSLLAVIMLWLPFGFSLIGLIEEWDVLAALSTHHFWIVSPDTPLAAHSLRPLTIFPHALANFLDPNSFVFWHVLLIIGLVLKGTFFSLLIYFCTRSVGWSLFAGPLMLLYPADTMQLSFRAIHINWAVLLSLMGIYAWTLAYTNAKSVSSYVYVTLGALLLFLACAMYEIAIALAVVPFFLVITREGVFSGCRSLWHQKTLIAIWCAGALSYVIYALWMSASISSAYQDAAFAGDPIMRLIVGLPRLLSVGGLRVIFGGWVDAYRIMVTEYSHYAYLLCATTLLGLLLQGMSSLTQSSDKNNIQSAIRLIGIGIILALIGYLPFLLTPTHMQITQRAYLFATPGAAMAWIGIFMCFSYRSSVLAKLCSVFFLLMGLSAQIFQFDHYVQIGERQRAVLREIVENFDGEVGQKPLLILDGTQQFGQTWMFLDGGIRNTLTYLYNHPFNDVLVCHMPSMEWQRPDSMGKKGTCHDEGEFWVFRARSSQLPDVRIKKGDLVEVFISQDGRVINKNDLTKYQDNLRYGDDVVSNRYRHVLLPKKQNFIYKSLFDRNALHVNYHWRFGDWWNLDYVRQGSGWRETEWQVNAFNHSSFAWLTDDHGTLVFSIDPLKTKYLLSVRFAIFMGDQPRQSMRISINDFPLHYHWVNSAVVEADVPSNVLIHGRNVLSFIFSPTADPTGLYAGVAEYRLEPSN